MIVATAGHVDHGKTTLIKAITGIDTTHLPEERRRSMTIDLGFAELPAGDGRFIAFIDVPGHERYIRNMLAGITGIDLAMLIVAADDGVMPQTREHLEILDLLRVPSGVAVITKIDRAPSEHVEQVAAVVAGLLAKTCLGGAPIFRVDALGGAGVYNLRSHLFDEASRPRPPRPGAYFRLPVDRNFVVDGAGLVVAGTVAAARVSVDDRLVVLPANIPVRARKLHTHHEAVNACADGERCALNIVGPGLDRSRARRGAWIAAPEIAVVTNRVDIRFVVAANAELHDRLRVHICHGASNIGGRVHMLQSGKFGGGARGFAQVVLDFATHALVGDALIIRDAADRHSLAGGVVLDPFPASRGRRRPARLAMLIAFDQRDVAVALAAALSSTPDGVDLERFGQGWNRSPEEIDQIGAKMGMIRYVRDRRMHGVDGVRWRGVRSELLAKIDRSNAEQAGGPGMTAASLLACAPAVEGIRLKATVLDTLLREGTVVRSGAHIRRPGANIGPGSMEPSTWHRIEPLLCLEDGPLTTAEIAARLDLPRKAVEITLQKIGRSGQVVRVAPNRYLHALEVAKLAAMAETLAREGRDGLFDAASYRKRAALGRNLTIAVLEHFDRIGLTRRIGNRRRMLRPAGSV